MQRPKSKSTSLTLCLAMLFSAGCKNDPDALEKSPGVATIRATIKTAIPLAYATSVAARAIQGESLAGVSTTQTCTDYPCAAAVTITAKAGAFPAQLDKYGKIIVLGLWPSNTNAVVAVTFVDMDVGIESLRVSSVGPFPVAIKSSGIELVYASQDINITTDPSQLDDATIQSELTRLASERPSSPDTRVSLQTDTWIIDVDNMSTPTDFSDDQYKISGASQYVDAGASSASILQLVMIDSALSTQCVVNPTSGYAVINQVGANSKSEAFPVFLGTATLRFHSRCDGNATVEVAFGEYFKSLGKQVALGL